MQNRFLSLLRIRKFQHLQEKNHLTYWNGSGEYQFKVNALSKGTTPVSFYANKSFFKNSKCFKPSTTDYYVLSMLMLVTIDHS